MKYWFVVPCILFTIKVHIHPEVVQGKRKHPVQNFRESCRFLHAKFLVHFNKGIFKKHIRTKFQDVLKIQISMRNWHSSKREEKTLASSMRTSATVPVYFTTNFGLKGTGRLQIIIFSAKTSHLDLDEKLAIIQNRRKTLASSMGNSATDPVCINYNY